MFSDFGEDLNEGVVPSLLGAAMGQLNLLLLLERFVCVSSLEPLALLKQLRLSEGQLKFPLGSPPARGSQPQHGIHDPSVAPAASAQLLSERDGVDVSQSRLGSRRSCLSGCCWCESGEAPALGPRAELAARGRMSSSFCLSSSFCFVTEFGRLDCGCARGAAGGAGSCLCFSLVTIDFKIKTG